MSFIIYVIIFFVVIGALSSSKKNNNSNGVNRKMPQNRMANPNNPYNAAPPNAKNNTYPQGRNQPQYNIGRQPEPNQLKERLSSKYGGQLHSRQPSNAPAQRINAPAGQPPLQNTAVPNNRVYQNQRQQQPVQNKPAPDSRVYQNQRQQQFSDFGTTDTLVLSDAPSSLLMGMSSYDFSFWGIGGFDSDTFLENKQQMPK